MSTKRQLPESRTGVSIYLNGGGKISGIPVKNPEGGYIYKSTKTGATSSWADPGYIILSLLATEAGTDSINVAYIQVELIDRIEGLPEILRDIF